MSNTPVHPSLQSQLADFLHATPTGIVVLRRIDQARSGVGLVLPRPGTHRGRVGAAHNRHAHAQGVAHAALRTGSAERDRCCRDARSLQLMNPAPVALSPADVS